MASRICITSARTSRNSMAASDETYSAAFDRLEFFTTKIGVHVDLIHMT
jgi:hypothetical protein